MLSESRIKQMKRIARIFESVSSFNPRQSAIQTNEGIAIMEDKL